MGSTLYSNLSGQTKKFKPFTQDHYRYDLEVLTGISPTRNLHAHHIFPQQYREQLAKIGINIDDPQYLTWWESGAHRSAHTKDCYNLIWQEFISTNPADDRKKPENIVLSIDQSKLKFLMNQ